MRSTAIVALGCLAAALVVVGAPAAAVADEGLVVGPPALLSYSTDGVQGDGGSYQAGLVADGSEDFFCSAAHNFDSLDGNGCYERLIGAGITTRVTVDSEGQSIPTSGSGGLAVSSSGQQIAFGAGPDVYYRNLDTGITQLIGAAPSSVLGNIAMSQDGRYVAYDTVGTSSSSGALYLYDATSGTTEDLTSAVPGLADTDGYDYLAMSGNGQVLALAERGLESPTGEKLELVDLATMTLIPFATPSGATVEGEDPGYSISPLTPSALSANGQFFVFTSKQSGLVHGDTNGNDDVFMYDLAAQTFARESLGPGNTQSYGRDGSISSSGRYVSFISEDANLAQETHSTGAEYVRDTETGEVAAVPFGTDEEGDISFGAVSGGYAIAGVSEEQLIPGDLNDQPDVYIASIEGSALDVPAADPADSQISATWAESPTNTANETPTAPGLKAALTAFAKTVEVRVAKGVYAPATLRSGRLVYRGSATHIAARHLKNGQSYSLAIFRLSKSGQVITRQVLTASPKAAASTKLRVAALRAAKLHARLHVRGELIVAGHKTPVPGVAVRLLVRTASARKYRKVDAGKTSKRGRVDLTYRTTHAGRLSLELEFPGNPYYRHSSRTLKVTVRQH